MRYPFLHICALTLLSCAGGEKSTSPPETEHSRPNILFIMSDDHARKAVSAYDSTLILTPNIDRIARQGMRFTNASVTNSICAPSRATILTGKHASVHGKIDNLGTFDTTQMTFPQHFQQAGYQTAMFGKLHFGNTPKGIDDFMIVPGQGRYVNPDFVTSHGDTLRMTGYATDVITDLTLDWLDRKRNPEKPFLMLYLHKAPHRPWWPDPERFAEFSQRTFPEPASLFDDYDSRGTAAQTAEMRIRDHLLLSYDCKVLPEALEALGMAPDSRDTMLFGGSDFYRTEGDDRSRYETVVHAITEDFITRWPTMTETERTQWKYQRYLQDYLACIASVDENVGRVLDYLEESGLAKNTLVVYTSDQGFFLGEHGWFDKRFMYAESFNIPLLMQWPDVIAAGSESDALVQNLDFAQTFLDAAGIGIPDDMQGQSLLPLMRGHPDGWQRDAVYYHYYEYPGEHAVKRHYGISTKDYKLMHFYHDVDEWELYDLMKDPFEMRNVYSNPDYGDVLVQLKEKLELMEDD